MQSSSIVILAKAIMIISGTLIGACMGSGILCCIMRQKNGESWVKGRSHCDSCGHILGFLDLIPIVSYLMHEGKCRYCGAKIPEECLIAELISGMIGATIAVEVVTDMIPAGIRYGFLAITTILGIAYFVGISRIQKQKMKGAQKDNHGE